MLEMVKVLLGSLKGKRTHIVAVVGVVLNVLYSQGLITDKAMNWHNWMLAFLAFIFLREGVKTPQAPKIEAAP